MFDSVNLSNGFNSRCPYKSDRIFKTMNIFSDPRFKTSEFDMIIMVRQVKLVQASWTIQPGQSLTSRPEQNFAYMEVTKYVEPKGWQIIDHNESEGIEPRNE